MLSARLYDVQAGIAGTYHSASVRVSASSEAEAKEQVEAFMGLGYRKLPYPVQVQATLVGNV